MSALLTGALGAAGCGPGSASGPATVAVRSALAAGTAPIAVGSDATVSIFALGNGAVGQFARFAEGHTPHTIAMGDVNGDGQDEIIVASSGSFRVFTQFGNETAPPLPPMRFLSGDAVATGDFDGDGRDEIVIGSTVTIGGGEVNVFSTDPAVVGSTPLASNLLFPLGSDIAVCDLDGNGRPEIVVAPAFRIFHVAVVGNTTSSSKQLEAEETLTDFFPAGRPTFSRFDRIACADLDGDHFDDLIVAHADSSDYQIFTHPSRPPVTFFPPASGPTFLRGWEIVAGDLDGDGVAELAIGGAQGAFLLGKVTVYSAPGRTPPAVFQGSTSVDVSNEAAFAIGRHPSSFGLDQDGDSIPDPWETLGIDIDGDGCVDYDLAAQGANPGHKDLFVEVDGMDCRQPQSDCAAGDTHTHLPDLSATGLGPVIDAFAAAPLTNPDGTSGVTLHIQIDDSVSHESTIDLDRTKVIQDALFGSAAERAQTTGVTINGRTPCATTPARVLAAKRQVFRYALFGHRIAGGSGFTGVTPGNDTTAPRFLLGLFTSTAKPNSDPPIMDATFMHELGHSLGLEHGGADRFNWKPNYLSVMNYRFNTGIYPTSGGVKLDYSREGLAPLFEANGPPICFGGTCVPDDLFELGGIGSADRGLYTQYLCPGGTLTTVPALGNIDWNCNMTLTAGIKTYPNPAVTLPPNPELEITVISDVNGDRFCVDPDPNTGILKTVPASGSDDFIMGGQIGAGPNGVLESAVKSAGRQLDDVVVAVPPPPPPVLNLGRKPPQAVVVAGPNKRLDTAIASGSDDEIVLYHVDPGSNGKIDVVASNDDVVYNDATSLANAIRQVYGGDVLNELTRDVQPLFPLLAPGANHILDSVLGDDGVVPVILGPGPNGFPESATASNGLQGDDVVDTFGNQVLPGPDGFLQTTPVSDEMVKWLRIVDGPNRVCETSPSIFSTDVQSDEDGNEDTFRFPGSVQQSQLTGYDDWHHLLFQFRGTGTRASHTHEQTVEQLVAQFHQSAVADVTLAVSASKPSVSADAPVTYHVTVTNHGPAAATSARVTAKLPDGMILDACQLGDGGTCVDMAAIFATVASGATATADFTAHTRCTQAAGSTVSLLFSVTTESTDPKPGDNLATISSTVAATKPSFTFVPPTVLTSSCVTVALGTPVAADACSPTVTISNDAPTRFALGRTTVTWRATSAGGAQTTATQAVTAVLADDDSCCPVGSHKIIGTSNNDVLTGTSGADCILGRGGQDHITGGGGDDAISGGDGDDFIDGQDGNDKLYGGQGQDVINGGAGNDLIDGGDGDDACSGGIGDDTLYGGQGQDHLTGDAGNDRLFGQQGTDVLTGGTGNDYLEGGQAGTTAGTTDQCTAGGGTDVFVSCPSRPDAPAAPDACHDGALDGAETGVDCGSGCFPCAGGAGCQVGADCLSGVCSAGVCAPSKTPLWAALVITSDWGAGYCAALQVTNLGSSPTTNWSARIDTNASTTTSTWVGAFDATTGSVLITPPVGQTAIAAGATNGAIGFCANRTTPATTFPIVLNRGGAF